MIGSNAFHDKWCGGDGFEKESDLIDERRKDI